MKRAIILLVVLLALALPAFAADVKPIWTAQAANVATPVDVSTYQSGQVVVWAASGTPDGTVTIYDTTPGAPSVKLAEYPTPTAAKKFRGPVGVSLLVVLSGNTTGTVGAVAVLK